MTVTDVGDLMPWTILRIFIFSTMAIFSQALFADTSNATITAPTGSISVSWNQTVSFSATSTDDQGFYGYNVNNYSWTFGDGTSGTGQSIDHVYSSAGSYTATLTVSYTIIRCTMTDANGDCYKTIKKDLTATATRTITVAPVVVSVPTPSNGSVNAGSSLQFSTSVTGALTSAVTWSVTGGGSINGNGLFTATMAGTYVVTATSVADPTKRASTNVTVNSTVTGVNINPVNVSLGQGEACQFTASAVGLGGINAAVTWSTNGGTITSGGSNIYTAPIQSGTFTVTATSVQNTTKSAIATVTVASIVVGMPIPTNSSVNAGSSQQFHAGVSGVINTGVNWSVSGGGTIDSNGLFSATNKGTYTVTAISVMDASKSASTSVTVNAIVTDVNINPTNVNMLQGEKITFTALAVGQGGNNPAVTWTADRGSVSNGVYTAPMADGDDFVRATSVQDPGKNKAAWVHVSPISISIPEPTNFSLNAGENIQYHANVTGAVNTNVIWKISDGGTMQPNGLFFATTAGDFTVTALSEADTNIFTTTRVTVKAVVTGVSISANGSLLFKFGEKRTFTATVNGVGITNPGVTWQVLDVGGGTITSLGVYTAPSKPGSYRIQAMSNQDGTSVGIVTIQIKAWVLKLKREMIGLGAKVVAEVSSQ